MSALKAARTAQYPLSANFTFNFDDTALDSVSGASKTFGAAFADDIVFDAIPLPQGAVITGGELIVETAGVGPTVYTVKLGIAGNDAIYLAATSLLATGRTALLLTTPLGSNGGANARLTISSTVANATAGRFRLRIEYVMDNRANETVIV